MIHLEHGISAQSSTHDIWAMGMDSPYVYTRITDMRDILTVTSTTITNTAFPPETRRFETTWQQFPSGADAKALLFLDNL